MVSFKKDFKMHIMKQTIKFVAPRILRISKGVQASTPQSKLIQRVWDRLVDVLEKDASTGCFDDNNFRMFLEATKQGLIYLCENDRYYKRWFGLLALILSEELHETVKGFRFEDAVQCNARPLMLTKEEFLLHETSLFELYLSGYLYGLSMLPKEAVETIKKAREGRGMFQIPSRDPNAITLFYFPVEGQPFFRLLFNEREVAVGEEERQKS